MAATDDTRQRSVPSPFSQLLRRLRTAADITQEELAERAGVSARLISDLERGMILRPRRDTIQMLADGLRLVDAERAEFIEAARGRAPAGAEPTVLTSPARLPLPPTALVGREREVAATTSLLTQPDTRLVTLTGPGGVGKTRLALDVAARVAPAFAGGAVFVDLAPLTDPARVLPAIAQALGLRDTGDAPIHDSLIEALQQSPPVLVLDNMEHLAPAAPEIAHLLEHCAGLTILATSRQPLRLRAEWEYPVAPLALPNLLSLPATDELASVPSIDLFIRRAESARHAFALTPDNASAVAELAVRLDGLPLAIELAAARVKVLAPADLLARLDQRLPLLTGGAHDLPARQRTMRSTIDWSYDLLPPAERQLFRLLAVFAGGFTLEAAEAVAGCDAPLDVLDGVTSLIDKNLLRAHDGPPDGVARFGMLETIREYGAERLAAEGETDDARDRHATWALAFAEQAGPELTGPDQQHWYRRLETEQDNLRAALNWAVSHGDADTAQRIACAIYRFWVTEGHFSEGRHWLERALTIGGGRSTAARGWTLIGAGVVAYFTGDYPRAIACNEEARVVFSDIGDLRGVASSYGNLGLIADAEMDYDRAVALYEEALDRFRDLDDQTHIRYMVGNLGLIAYFQERYGDANALMAESLALARAAGDRHSESISLGNLGMVALEQGDYDRALDLQRQVLRMRRELTNLPHLARTLENVAMVAAMTGAPIHAARLFGAADALRTEVGGILQANDLAIRERYITRARAQTGEHAFTAAWTDGAALSPDEALNEALDGAWDRAPSANRPQDATAE